MNRIIILLLLLAQPLWAASTYQLEDANGQTSWQVNKGDQFEVYLRITNNDKVGIVGTTIQFDAAVLSIDNVQGLTNAVTGEEYAITELNISGGQVAFFVSTAAFTTGFPDGTQLVKLTFTALSAGPTNIMPVNTEMTSLAGSITVDPAPTGVNIEVLDPNAFIPSTYRLEDSNGQDNWSVNLGDNTEVYLKIDNQDKIGIVITTIEFDPNILSTTAADIYGLTNANTGENYAITNASVNNGQIQFTVSTSAFTNGFPDGTHIAKIVFKTLAKSNATQIIPVATEMTSLSGSFMPQNPPNSVSIQVTELPTVIPGDADGDGDVDVYDAYLIYDMALGNEPETAGGDCDENGMIEVYDAYCAYNKAISL